MEIGKLKLIQLSIAFFLVFISAGCIRNTSVVSYTHEGIPVIDIEKVMAGKKQEFLLSDIAYDIEYIPLEFTKECPLRMDIRWNLHVSSSDIFVLSANKIFRFNRKGKFLNSIGAHGRGPGEFIIALDFTVDTVARHVYLHSNERQIHVYDYSGKHIRSMHVGGSLNRGFYYLDKTNELFFSSQTTYELHYEENYEIKITDTLGNIHFSKNALVVEMLREGETQSYSSSTLQDGNDIFAIDGMSDTLFCYRQSVLVPYLILDRGRYKITIEAMRSYNYKEDFGRCLNTQLLGSTPDYLFISFFQVLIPEPRKRFYLRYNKSTGESIQVDPVIVNDWDGGMPKKIGMNNLRNQWIFAFDAFEMIETLTPEYFSSAKAKNPEAKHRLQQLVKNLKEEDNPVLMRIILKP